jgi:hypothetical protein
MSRLHLRSWVAAAALAAIAGIGACSKTGSPPSGFGVNITVDASDLSATNRAKIKSATLRAVSDKAGADVITSSIDKFADAVQGGTVRFHYTPADSVKAGERLTIGIDALGAAAMIIASGSGKTPPLAATAVELTIKLEGGGGDGGAPPTDGPEEEVAPGKKALGTACVVDDDCNSGFCADQVCCNSKCTDVCASCSLSATKGTCTAYEVNTDPEMECTVKLPPVPTEEDAGSAPVADGATDAAGDTAGAAAPPPGDAAAAEVAESDAAVINQPDGGFMSMPNACGGTCSGAKSCKYPGKTVSCGKAFCNTRREVGSFFCDGAGGCNIELSQCSDYSCDPDNAMCKTQCGGNNDCLGATKYCNGTTSMCAPKKDNGIACANGGECTSGNCVDKICCNTAACDAAQGLSCATGKCVCPGVSCAAGVACQVFFQDLDGDKFGNKNGTILAGTAKAGCAGTPPVGFVADNTDCDDGDANAHPGQTDWFMAASKGIGTFDYNCDGSETKETPEYPGGTCKYCGAVGMCDTTSTTCDSTTKTGSFVCPQEIAVFTRLALPVDVAPDLGARMSLFPTAPDLAAAAPAAAPGEVLPPPVILPPKLPQCCGCAAADKTGFISAVKCGASGTPYTCGSCASVGGASPRTAGAAKIQRCR